MNPLAFSQVLEQIVRISLVAVCTTVFLPYGIEYAATGAMISSVIGELASLIYLFICFKANKTIRIRKQFFKSIANGKETFRQLMSVSLPTTGSRFIGNLSWFFEPIVVAQSLAIAGVATVAATSQYGELTGFAMTVLTSPSFITYSLSTALVPAISEGMEQKKPQVVEYRLEQAMRLCLLSGGISVVILFSFADELMSVMYGSTNAAVFVKVMAPFFLLYYFQGPLQAVLAGSQFSRGRHDEQFYRRRCQNWPNFCFGDQAFLGHHGRRTCDCNGDGPCHPVACGHRKQGASDQH